MNTTTINITLPIRLKREIDQRINSGFYTSVSEFIRHAVRRLLTSAAETEIPYGQPFSVRAAGRILAAEKETLKNRKRNIVLKTPEEIDNFFESL